MKQQSEIKQNHNSEKEKGEKKKEKRPWLCGWGLGRGGVFRLWAGPMFRTHRAGKGPGGRGSGLGSTKQKGPRRASRLPRVGGANALLTSPAPQVLEGPSHLPLLFSPTLPPTPPGPTQPGAGLWGHRTWPESWAGFLGQLGRGNARCTPPWSEPPRVPPGVGTPPPSQPPLSGTVLSCLHFCSPLSPPTSYPVAWGFFPSPWASRSPASVRQAP